MYSLTKKLAGLIFGDYSAFHIYAFSAGHCHALAREGTGLQFAIVDKAQIAASGDPSIVERASYHGSETHAYAALQGTRIVSVCYFWYGARYRRRNFWPLGDHEAKLVEIVTVPEIRGQGAATHLIAYAADDMLRKGFHRLYARIWHSNKASLKAFRRAGWGRVATVVELYPLRRTLPLRMTFRQQYA